MPHNIHTGSSAGLPCLDGRYAENIMSHTQPHQPQRAPLDAAALSARLQAVGFPDVSAVHVTGSTNSDLCARVDAVDGTVLLAEEQSAGRGRLNRAWSAPEFSQVIVSVSFLLPEVPADKLGLVPLLAGLSIGRGIRDIAGVHAQLKWPNDVLVDGRKLVGILVEAPQVAGTPRVVVGFGLNYDLTREELPVPHATSLALEAASEDTALPSREDLIVGILLRLGEDLGRFRRLGGAPQTFLPRYLEMSATMGSDLRVMLPGDRILEGTAVDISETGELVVDKDGTRHTVAAGDVVHVRPGGGGEGAY